MFRRSLTGLFALTCAFFFGLTSTAHADTYVEYVAGVSSGSFGYVFAPGGVLIGGKLGQTTYQFTYTGDVSPVSSFPLVTDDGTPCTPTDTSAYMSVSGALCNNGFEAFHAFASTSDYFGGIYHGPDPATDAFFVGNAGGIRIDSFGDVAFTDYNFSGALGLADYTVVFFDLTTHTAVTPEPNSALLIATALLLLCGLRFRFAHS